jgi:hypothetical protein
MLSRTVFVSGKTVRSSLATAMPSGGGMAMSERQGQIEGLLAARSFARHRHIGLEVEQHTEAAPYERVIVGDKQSARRSTV